MNTQTKAFPLLSIVHGLSEYHHKHYCYPSQVKFKELLQDRLGVVISIATLNRWLRVVEDMGYLQRKRRIRKDKRLGLIFKSTMYFMTYQGYLLLARQGVNVWSKVKEFAVKVRQALVSKSKKEEKEPAWKDKNFISSSEGAARAVQAMEEKAKLDRRAKFYREWDLNTGKRK